MVGSNAHLTRPVVYTSQHTPSFAGRHARPTNDEVSRWESDLWISANASQSMRLFRSTYVADIDGRLPHVTHRARTRAHVPRRPG